MISLSPELWGAVIGGTFTFAVTLIGVLIQGRQSIKLARIRLDHDDRASAEAHRRENLEELIVALKQWIEALVGEHMFYIRVMEGVLTYNQALDLTIKHAGDMKYDHNRFETLIALYFPKLTDPFLSVRNIQDKINDVRENFRNLYAQGTTSSHTHASEMRRLIGELNRQFNVLESIAIREFATNH